MTPTEQPGRRPLSEGDREALAMFIRERCLNRASYLRLGISAEDYALMECTPRMEDVDELLLRALEIAPERLPGDVLYMVVTDAGESPIQVCLEGDPIRAGAMLEGIELHSLMSRDDADQGVPTEWTA